MANSPVPAIAVWCGLQRLVLNDEGQEVVLKVDVPGVGVWWRITERHPEDLAAELHAEGSLPGGVYRAAWAPKDRRRHLVPGEWFTLGEQDEDDGGDAQEGDDPDEGEEADEDEEEDEEEEEEGEDDEDDEEEAPLAPSPPPLQARIGPASTQKARRAPPAVLTRPAARIPRRPEIRVPFDPPARGEESPLATFVYLNALAEAQRDREHQLTLQLMGVMIATVDARAEAAIASERSRSDQVLAFVSSGAKERTRADMAPLEQKIAALQEQLLDVADARAEDAAATQEAIGQHLATVAQQPEGPQAVIHAIGSFLQSDAGRIVAEGIKRLIVGEQAPQRGPVVYDPAGG